MIVLPPSVLKQAGPTSRLLERSTRRHYPHRRRQTRPISALSSARRLVLLVRSSKTARGPGEISCPSTADDKRKGKEIQLPATFNLSRTRGLAATSRHCS